MHIDAPYPVFTGSEAYTWLQKWMENESFDRCFVLTDSSVSEHCLPIFLERLTFSQPIHPIVVPTGESHKSLATAEEVWKSLMEHRASRRSLLVALGGGMVTDLAGFIASTFKRGMPLVSVPTTLLAQVDAAFGGKTGIDFNGVKNAIGTFYNPSAVLIDPVYLKTLSQREVRSGWAEMIKYGWVADAALWREFREHSLMDLSRLESWIYRCIAIKNEIVSEDPTETGRRKCLNFGHTIGHALEAWALETEMEAILHGEAIAAGMIIEAYLSTRYAGLPEQELMDLIELLEPYYPPIPIEPSLYNQLLELMEQDKKNAYGELRFTLIPALGSCIYNEVVPPHDVIEALEFYRGLSAGSAQSGNSDLS